MIPDVAQSLDDDALAPRAGGETEGSQILGVLKAGADAIVDAPSGGFGASRNALHGNRFARDTGIDVRTVHHEILVGVRDPTHLTLARAVIRRGHIDVRTDEVLPDEFRGKPPGHPFPESLRCRQGIDAHTAFRPAEGDADDGGFVRHERRKRDGFVQADMLAESNATLGGQTVVAVLGAKRLHDPDTAVILPHGKPHPVNRVAGLDLLKHAGSDRRKGRRTVEVMMDTLKEGASGHGF